MSFLVETSWDLRHTAPSSNSLGRDVRRKHHEPDMTMKPDVIRRLCDDSGLDYEKWVVIFSKEGLTLVNQFKHIFTNDKLRFSLIAKAQHDWEIDAFYEFLEGISKELKIAGINVLALNKSEMLEFKSSSRSNHSFPFLRRTDDTSYNKRQKSVSKSIHRDEVCTLGKILGDMALSEFYPNKIKAQDVMQLTEMKREIQEPKDIPWYLLEKLIMMDCRARDGLCNILSSLNTVDGKTLDDLIKETARSSSRVMLYHPLDIFITVFQCCDPFLKQSLFKKMSLCQLAVPLVIPTDQGLLYPLWALEATHMEWRNKKDKACEAFLARHEMYTISFCKFGKLQFSKSHLLNTIMSEKYHDIFVNRECQDGNVVKHISQGTVELAYFLPANKKSDIFDQEILFLNLRGDCSSYVDQMTLLKKISNTVVLIFEIEVLDSEMQSSALQDALSNSNHCIVIISCQNLRDDDGFKKYLEYLKRITENQKNIEYILTFHRETREYKTITEISSEIRQRIRELTLHDVTQLKSIKDSLVMNGIMIDEIQSKPCQWGMEKSIEVISVINTTTINNEFEHYSSVKKSLLPLQGDLWQKWSALSKQRHRNGKSKDLEKLNVDMEAIRMNQYKLTETLSPLVQKITQLLSRKVENRDGVMFFIRWLQLEMDYLSSHFLPELRKQYFDGWRQSTIEGSISIKQLNTIEKNFAEASLGMEHVFREIGQLYEASAYAKKLDLWKNLPQLMAQLLVDGIPFEIMDGDAASVPLTWVEAVLKELISIIGDKRVFVLSVVGIQSSGKSTLLNTMFGLEFPVSAGRCTRGIYAQLLKVHEKSKLPFDYVFVLDSEGLRAPELAQEKYSHDNELATLIIGVADLTLVNLKGENPTEMKDILQIVVQALLRMRLADHSKRQRCKFVHQNVPALNAAEKTRHERQKLKEHLDKMTLEAAKAEGRSDTITKFNHVIQFDIEHDVWYFSDLWSGEPPMAPINFGYSEKAFEAKIHFLSTFTKEEATMGPINTGCPEKSYETTQDFLSTSTKSKLQVLKLSDFILRLRDIWTAVQADDFVFTFRNTIAIKAHLSLENYFSFLTENFKSKVLKWFEEEGIKNSINKCDIENLDSVASESRKRVKEYIELAAKDDADKLESFFNNSEYSDILSEFRMGRVKLMKDDTLNFTQELLKDIRELCDMKRQRLSQDHTKKEFEKRCIEKVERLAKNILGKKGSDRDTLIDKEFTQMWEALQYDDESTHRMNASYQSVTEQLEEVLIKKYSDSGQQKYLNQYLGLLRQTSPVRDKLVGILSYEEIDQNDYTARKWYRKILKKVSKKEVMKILDIIFLQLDTDIDLICARDTKFYSVYGTELLNKIWVHFEKHNENNAEPFKFESIGIAKFSVIAMNFSIQKFEHMNFRYENKYGYASEKSEFKDISKRLFLDRIHEKSESVTKARFFSGVIRREVLKTARGRIGRKVIHTVYTELGRQKYHLITKILDHLLKADDFQNIIEYVNNSHGFSFKWIEDFTNHFMFSTSASKEETEYFKMLKEEIIQIFEVFDKAVTVTSENLQSPNGNTLIADWIREFCNALSKCKYTITESEFNPTYSTEPIGNISTFAKDMHESLEEAKNLLLADKDLQAVNQNTVHWENMAPYEKILNKLWGCTHVCPFCREPCMKLEHNSEGEHHCIQHRPQGVSGWRELGVEILVWETCNFNVSSDIKRFRCHSRKCPCQTATLNQTEIFHLYRDYATYFPKWNIAPNATGDASAYWKYVLCKYKNDFVKHYEVKFPNVQKSWYNITKEEALHSLREYEG